MLSLVNYGSSGESGNDDLSEEEDGLQSRSVQPTHREPTKETPIENVGKKPSENIVLDNSICDDEEPKCQEVPGPDRLEEPEIRKEKEMLSALPPPVKNVQDIPWEQLSKLTYRSQAIRIMAPAIPEIDKEDEEEEKKKKRQASKTGSGLLGLLPKPKHEFMAQPRVLRPAVKLMPRGEGGKASIKVRPVKTKAVKAPASDSEEEEADCRQGDFFSLSSVGESPEEHVLPGDLPPLPAPLSSKPVVEVADTKADPLPVERAEPQYMAVQPDQEVELDEDALTQLCGRRGLKRRAEQLKMIDIDGSSLLPDQTELTKNLTAGTPMPSRPKGFGPTSQQKRKHQIIYLAHQAKEQELELQNTWANNRMSRKQTQAKYGF